MTFHEMVNIIFTNKRVIIRITIVTTLMVFIYLMLISPKTYLAPVTVLPPSKPDNMGGLRGLIGGNDFSSLILGDMAQGNSQLYVEILKSRSAAEYVVKKLNLVEYYDTENMYSACNKLQKNLEIDLSKEGIITLSVNNSSGFIPWAISSLDSIKDFTAKLSNTYIEALDKINREKISYKAKRAREYIEQQLEVTKSVLDSAEISLMEFQKKNKAISLPEQLNAAIENSAKLKTEIIKTEIEIGLLEPNLREDNQVLISLKKKLSELKREYDKLEIGTEDYLVAFNDVPELSMEFAKLFREVKIQNEIYLLLQQQYYQEKIQENRDLPTIEILDEAIPPLKASSPRIIYSSSLSAIFIFLLISLYFIIKGKKLALFKSQKIS